MATPQPGIFVRGLRAQAHLEFDLRPGVTVAAIRAAFGQLQEVGLVQSAVAGFGDRLWRLLAAADAVPLGLAPLARVQGTGGDMPVHQHDAWLWLADRGPDVVFDAARLAVAALAPALTLVEDTPGFVYRDGRDLTGFIDGSENPAPDAAVAVACIADGPGAGGAFALVQRWRHNLTRFQALAQDEQERAIGRTKPDSVQLPELPANSHVARMVVATPDGELAIWRRSVPWGKATANGLQFVAFSADPQRFTAMLERMFGAAPDGVADRLLEFSTPETGALYFVPSTEALLRWVRG